MFSVQPTTEIGKDSCIIGIPCNFPLLLKDAHIMRLFLALHRSIFVGKTSNNIITGPFPLKARSLSLTKREKLWSTLCYDLTWLAFVVSSRTLIQGRTPHKNRLGSTFIISHDFELFFIEQQAFSGLFLDKDRYICFI